VKGTFVSSGKAFHSSSVKVRILDRAIASLGFLGNALVVSLLIGSAVIEELFPHWSQSMHARSDQLTEPPERMGNPMSVFDNRTSLAPFDPIAESTVLRSREALRCPGASPLPAEIKAPPPYSFSCCMHPRLSEKWHPQTAPQGH
jgi:hypothetical protein